eukprot:gene17823-24206_t
MLCELPQDVLIRILQHLDGKSAAKTQVTCTLLAGLVSSDDLWEQICSQQGFRQLAATRTRGKKAWKSGRQFRQLAATRTRGKKAWKDVFISNLCSECRATGESRGLVKIDLSGGTYQAKYFGSLVPLCVECVESVQAFSLSQRQKCLPRMKAREYQVWSTTLYKIPSAPPSKGARSRPQSVAEGRQGADYNDYLLTTMVAKKKKSRRK